MGISGKTKSYLRRAVFLDRDGVINNIVDRGENFFVAGKKVRFTAPFAYEEFKLKDGVERALHKIHLAGFLAILVTNQPDISYGLLLKEDHEKITAEINKLPFDDIYVCPHGRYDGCDCKKPKPGMLFSAAEKWGINLTLSVIVGDSESDIGAGRAAGCKTILIKNDGNGRVTADEYAADLTEAVQKLEDVFKANLKLN